MKAISLTFIVVFAYAYTGYAQTHAEEKQCLYTIDASCGKVYKVDIETGKYSMFVGNGPGVSLDFDSKGNLYRVGGLVEKVSPDGKRVKKFLVGLKMDLAVAIDSEDNLYTAEYYQKNSRVFKIPLKKVTDDMLPITVMYKDNDLAEQPTFKPEGLVTVIQDKVVYPYGLSIDAYDNVYMTRLNSVEFPSFYKYTPEGKVSPFGWGASWPRNVCIDANGEFYAIGHNIVKISSKGRRIGAFAPCTDFHHSIGIDLDANGNLYQANARIAEKPGPLATDGTPVNPDERGAIYKYTPDGRRTVVTLVGCKLFGVRIMPKNKYPTTRPME